MTHLKFMLLDATETVLGFGLIEQCMVTQKVKRWEELRKNKVQDILKEIDS